MIYDLAHQIPTTYAFEFPRQSGKTTELEQFGAQVPALFPGFLGHLFPHLRHGVRLGLYGPTREKAAKLRDKIKWVLESPLYSEVFGIEFEVSNGIQIRLNNNSSILVSTASDQAKAVEQPSFHCIITEETQSISSRRIVKSLRPMLSSTLGVMVHIGTASDDPKEHGEFYKMMMQYEQNKRRGIQMPNVIRLGLKEIFKTDGTQNYRRFVKEEIRTHGRTNPYILANYFGVWDVETNVQFVKKAALDAICTGRRYGISDLFWQDVVAGIDVANARDDTVCTMYQIPKQLEKPIILLDAQGNDYESYWTLGRVVGWLWLLGDNYPEQARSLKKFMSHYPNLISGYVDIRGPGDALLDDLQEDRNDGLPTFPQLLPDQPTQEQINMEDEALRQAILALDFTYPADECPDRIEFEMQITSLMKVKDKKGNVRVDHPRTGKKDFWDSLRLARKAGGEFEELKHMEEGAKRVLARKRGDLAGIKGRKVA